MSFLETKPTSALLSPSPSLSGIVNSSTLNGFVTNGFKLFPNRIFVGGMSRETTESDLIRYFAAFGSVKSAKIITDIITGTSKGYGFVTFSNEEDALRLQQNSAVVIMHNRKLNIGPAIKRNVPGSTTTSSTNGGQSTPSGLSSSVPPPSTTQIQPKTEMSLTSGLEALSNYTLFPNGIEPMLYPQMLPYYGVPFNFPYMYPTASQLYQNPY